MAHADSEAQSGEPSRGRLLRRVAVGLALVAHLALVLSVASQPLAVNHARTEQRSAIWPLHNDTVHRVGPAADFFAVYHAGYNLKNGHSPYSHKEIPQKTPYLFTFRYLPVVGQTLGWIASAFDPLMAWRGWVVMLEVVLLLFVFVFRRRVEAPWLKCLGTCLALLSSPYFLELHMGQFTFVTVALVLMGVMLHTWPTAWSRATTGAVAAVTFTAAVLLKLFPLATAPALARQRRFWPVLAVAIGVTAVVSLAFFIPNPVEWGIFVRKNFSRPVGGMHSGNFGLVYLIFITGKALGAAWVDAMQPWLGISSVVRNSILGISLLLAFLSRSPRMLPGVCLMLMAHFVSYIHVWEHHMSGVLLIGLALLAALYREEAAPPRGLVVTVVAALVVLALPTPFVVLDVAKDVRTHYPDTQWSYAAKALLVSSKALPTLILYGACAYVVAREGLGWPWRATPKAGENPS